MSVALSQIINAAPRIKRVARDTSQALFYALNERVPLIPITTRSACDSAVEMVRYLDHRFAHHKKMPSAVKGYLNTLLLLIEDYQKQHFSLDKHVSPAQLLAALLETDGLQQNDLVPECFGQKSLVSEFLAGKRAATWRQAKALGTYFDVDPVLFMA